MRCNVVKAMWSKMAMMPKKVGGFSDGLNQKTAEHHKMNQRFFDLV